LQVQVQRLPGPPLNTNVFTLIDPIPKSNKPMGEATGLRPADRRRTDRFLSRAMYLKAIALASRLAVRVARQIEP